MNHTPTNPDAPVQQVKLIQTRLLRRGDGKNTSIRLVEQWWTQDGRLVAENDPTSDIVTEEQQAELGRFIGTFCVEYGLGTEEHGKLMSGIAQIICRKLPPLEQPVRVTP